ncbi:MAG: hypothetical protein Q8W51_03165 [Candidatus Palauibacterales bacterium]|nr:hypothetical protein [Candidatus Palauibacterales bacterium]MDP2528712.1 hypothetical protein [Candidatus Palauibacterales bacterium]MDP2585242.1 hypothetical protein [Candidatus Palauibacterales bacterium]
MNLSAILLNSGWSGPVARLDEDDPPGGPPRGAPGVDGGSDPREPDDPERERESPPVVRAPGKLTW